MWGPGLGVWCCAEVYQALHRGDGGVGVTGGRQRRARSRVRCGEGASGGFGGLWLGPGGWEMCGVLW